MTAVASTLRHIATARAGAAAAAISGPDVDTARIAMGSSTMSARGGTAIALGRRLTPPSDVPGCCTRAIVGCGTLRP